VDENLTEEQQIEQLKRLWKEYGFAIVLGALIALSISFAWRFYNNYKTTRAEHAAIVYEQTMGDLLNGQTSAAIAQAKKLIKKFKSTPYASLSAFVLAQNAVESNKLDEAVKRLQWIIVHGNTKTFRDLARIRLARIYVEQTKSDDAIKLLKSVKSPEFIGLTAKVRGDAYLKLNQTDQARQAYQEAVDHLPASSGIYDLAKMALYNLPN